MYHLVIEVFTFVWIMICSGLCKYWFSFQECDNLILLHLGYLDYPNYIITVHFYGLENIKFNIKDIRFSVSIMRYFCSDFH